MEPIVLKIIAEDISEKEVQRAFEKSWESIEEGLQHISSFVPIGTGIIDSLAVDDDNNAVIIEFKRMGDFDEDALIQLMNYYSWFAADPNHKLVIDTVIRKVKPDFEGIRDVSEIRLVAIVSNVSDKVKNACWALEPYIKLVSYSMVKTPEGVGIVPKVVVDTSIGGEKLIRPQKTEEEHLKDHESQRTLYNDIKKVVVGIASDIKLNPAPQNYIGIVGRRTFAAIYFKRRWIRIDILLKPKDVGNNPRLTYEGSGDWSYVHIESADQIDEELTTWLKLAYDKSKESDI